MTSRQRHRPLNQRRPRHRTRISRHLRTGNTNRPYTYSTHRQITFTRRTPRQTNSSRTMRHSSSRRRNGTMFLNNSNSSRINIHIKRQPLSQPLTRTRTRGPTLLSNINNVTSLNTQVSLNQRRTISTTNRVLQTIMNRGTPHPNRPSQPHSRRRQHTNSRVRRRPKGRRRQHLPRIKLRHRRSSSGRHRRRKVGPPQQSTRHLQNNRRPNTRHRRTKLRRLKQLSQNGTRQRPTHHPLTGINTSRQRHSRNHRHPRRRRRPRPTRLRQQRRQSSRRRTRHHTPRSRLPNSVMRLQRIITLNRQGQYNRSRRRPSNRRRRRTNRQPTVSHTPPT